MVSCTTTAFNRRIPCSKGAVTVAFSGKTINYQFFVINWSWRLFLYSRSYVTFSFLFPTKRVLDKGLTHAPVEEKVIYFNAYGLETFTTVTEPTLSVGSLFFILQDFITCFSILLNPIYHQPPTTFLAVTSTAFYILVQQTRIHVNSLGLEETQERWILLFVHASIASTPRKPLLIH